MPGKGPPESWTATRDGCGQWRIVNRRGEEVFRHPDRLVRLLNTHLAAAAPQLADCLEMLAMRFERTGSLDRSDRNLLMECWGTLAVSRPGIEAITAALEERWQQEMELEPTKDLA
jgi:hypothetical protein